MLNKQTHTKPHEALEHKLTKSKQTFSIEPSSNLGLDSNWMVGLKSFEVYNSIFTITEENNNFEFFTDTLEEFSFEELKDELEEFLGISDLTPYHPQHEQNGPRLSEAYKMSRKERSRTDGYIILLRNYARSPFREFESYLRVVFGLDEEKLQLNKKNPTQILSLMSYLQVFTQLKLFQRLFTPWVITENHPI